MSPTLQQWLGSIEAVEGQQEGAFQVFGLRWGGTGTLAYRTLDEALASGTFEVAEVSEAGSVPTLRVTNRSDEPVFLMAGEHLVGAKQDRVLNASYLAAAHSTMPIPVSCVEAGRWRSRSAQFASGGTMSSPSLRRKMTSQAHEGYRHGGMPTSDQGEVWREVDSIMASHGSTSGTRAYMKVYEDRREQLDAWLAKFRAPEGCSGVAFAVGGQLAGADLFDRPETLAKLWPKLLRSHALDALAWKAEAAPIGPDAVGSWLRGGAIASQESYRSPGMGEDIRLEAASLSGSALVVDDRPIHAVLFPSATAGAP